MVYFRSTTYLPILGLDCEWVTENDVRHPVALLQIADNNGMCSLIRLSKLETIPTSLSVSIKLLELTHIFIDITFEYCRQF